MPENTTLNSIDLDEEAHRLGCAWGENAFLNCEDWHEALRHRDLVIPGAMPEYPEGTPRYMHAELIGTLTDAQLATWRELWEAGFRVGWQ